MNLSGRCRNLKDLNSLNLKQYRLRDFDNYSFITIDKDLEIAQLSKILMFTRRADYITINNNFICEKCSMKISEFKDSSEIVCHNRLRGENPKKWGVSIDDDEEDSENEENEGFDEEEEIENPPKEIDNNDPYNYEECSINPKDWTGWMRYDGLDTMAYMDLEEDILSVARCKAKQKLEKYLSRKGEDISKRLKKCLVDDFTRIELERTTLYEEGLVCDLKRWRNSIDKCEGIIRDIRLSIENDLKNKFFEKDDFNDPPIPNSRRTLFLKHRNSLVLLRLMLIVLVLVVGKIY
jgi:hypothetical protein